MNKKREYIWCLIEFPNGDEKWYCVSRVLREALLMAKKNDRYWKKKFMGNYLTVALDKYTFDRAPLTVGKVKKISISTHRTNSWNWTRNQFVTPDHLMNFNSAYNYLKHDYSWYNRFSIWMALRYWHNKLLQKKIKTTKKSIGRIRGKLFKYRK